jgi:geranylgeranyl pyrophosphate synthase
MGAREMRPTTIAADYKETVHLAMQAVEDAMNDVVNSEVTVLRDASRHILAAGGKRIRPRMLMLTYLALGGTDLEYAAPPAAAVELMHTASVVHDDINDHGVLRRGRPSVNAIWGRTFALLTGDFLFTAVYQLLAPYKDLNIVLARAATALVEGETLQAVAVKENNFTRETYARIIGLKTAALFQASAEMGALLAGAAPAQVAALAQFGYNIGLAFQIVDDILDIIGDETVLGKTAGIDIDQGRGLASVTDAPQGVSDVMESIKKKMLTGDRLNQGREQAESLVSMAIAQLDVLPDSPAKDELIALAEFAIRRNH